VTAIELAANALVSIPQARRFVYRSEDDSSRDDILVDAVNMVSDSIATHCRREFVDTTADPGPDVRTFAIAPGGWVDLSPYDLRELDEVIRYTDREASLQETLSSARYRLHPAGRTPEGTYLHLQLPAPWLAEAEPGFGWQCTVEGSWGMDVVPSEVHLAALQWIKNVVENPGGYATAAMNAYAITPDLEFNTPSTTAAGMPAAVRRRLARYRRFPVVM